MGIESKLILLTLALVMVGAAFAASNSESGLCGVSQSELQECKPAVAANVAAPPAPTTACCASLKHANLTCFCSFKNNKYLEPLFGINVTRAMQLPSQCDSTQPAPCH